MLILIETLQELQTIIQWGHRCLYERDAESGVDMLLKVYFKQKEGQLYSHFSSTLTKPMVFTSMITYEPRCEKTGFLHMPKQRRRSASR